MRIKIKDLEPEAYRTMSGFEHYMRSSTLDKKLLELVKIRASQINGCGYCLDLHTKDSLSLGEDQRRIFTLSAWRETELFTEAEQAALALVEEITLIANEGVSDTVYNQAAQYYDEHQMAQLIMATIAINAWNRFAITSKTIALKQPK
ncbi:MAG TPA: carboxymuconolactone decarboxylase family protein [Flavipsychrobacter sp.]|nr:carboxymuconolactone decarboxylase family protein [Flavipsychrobacter sp.]